MRSRRRPIDFVRQQNIRKDRSLCKPKILRLGVKNASPGNISRDKIGGELNPAKLPRETFRQRPSDQRLADSRHIFEQNMLPGKKRDQNLTDHLPLAEHNRRHILFKFRDFFRNTVGIRHCFSPMGGQLFQTCRECGRLVRKHRFYDRVVLNRPCDNYPSNVLYSIRPPPLVQEKREIFDFSFL